VCCNTVFAKNVNKRWDFGAFYRIYPSFISKVFKLARPRGAMTPRLAQVPRPAPLGAQGKQTLQQRASKSSKNEWLVWDEKITVDVYRHAQERASLMVMT
jgi:hypothetical protein